MRYFFNQFFFAVCILFSGNVNSQTTIADARLQGINANVTIRGVITNGSELGLIRYIEDGTGGLAIYSTSFASQLNRGDSVEVSGTIVDFNGLFELNPVTASTPFGQTTLPTPQLVTPSQLNETLESELVRLNGVVFSDGGSTITGNTSYTFSYGAEQATIYVKNGTALVGQTIPVGSIDLVGICSEYNTIYQVLARDMNDFITPDGINITSAVTLSNIQQNNVTFSWTTNIPGTTVVNYGLTPALELGSEVDNTPTSNHTIDLSTVDAGQIYYYQVSSSANGNTAYGPIKVFGTQSNSLGWIKAYFNHPVDTANGSNLPQLAQLNLLDDSLVAYINRAEETLDLTIYDFDNASISSISAAINAAYNRGVRVRFISDGNQVPTNFGVNDLLPAIPKIVSPTGGSYTIMHNKFVVIDANHTNPAKPIVWTGSTNWTDRQINRDPNNVIIVQDQTLARTYQLEFEEMWGSNGDLPDTLNSRFGSAKQDNTPHEFTIGGKRVECYFSPSDNTNDQLVRTILTADDSLHIATMLITRAEIAQAIDSVTTQGVNSQCYIDDATTTTVYASLFSTLGANLKVNPDTNVIMHHKFFVVDAGSESDPIVWTGSHNWSNNANTKNDENTLVVHDAQLADWYRRAFTRLTNPIVPDTSAGINMIDHSLSLSIYPSLVSRLSDLKISGNENEKASIQVIDQTGKVVYRGSIVLSKGMNQQLSMLTDVKDGIYYVNVNNSLRSKTQQVMVIH